MDTPSKPRPPQQQLLKLKPLHEIERDGIGMGILPDGTPYLTGAGLARMCGLNESTIREAVQNWASEQFKPRGMRLADLLNEQGYSSPQLYIPIEVNGSLHHAYPDAVCMAFLEYYAFDAGNNCKEQAAKNYRLLAKSSFRAFVYAQVGFDPSNRIPASWRQFHDRVSLTHSSVPAGYFGIFKEVADMVVAMIQAGVPVDEKTVPDVSVGQSWSKHWDNTNCEEKFGQRLKYEHNYPDYFPQAKSNPQYPWVYPDAALGEFRRWMREVYLTEKFPTYINSQAAKRALPPSIAQLAIEAVRPAALSGPTASASVTAMLAAAPVTPKKKPPVLGS